MLGILGALIAVAVVAASFLMGSSPLQPVEPGDTVLVTGSSSGIGKHAALSLAKEGYDVFACVRKTQDGEALLESAQYHGVNASLIHVLMLDVTNSDDISRGVETVSEFVGDRGLKGLFNNAGIGGDIRTGIESTSVEFGEMSLFRSVMEVNFFGVLQVTKAFLSLLRKGKGRIIMNTSIAGFFAGPFASYYTSSKHAVEGFSDSLRRELRPLGVKVSILEPGFVMTPILIGYTPPSKEPYVEAEQKFWKGFWKDSMDAPTPKVCSQAVIHAMRATEPQLRYVVGKDAFFLKLLRYLPPTWIDSLLEHVDQDVSDEDLQQLSNRRQTEFPL